MGLCLSFCLQVACSDDDNPTSTDGPGTSVDQGPDQKATDKGVTPADQSQGSQVKSSDGKVTLNIPKGALPSGVSVSDVKITPVAQKDVITSVTGASFLLAYRLTPDGTKLSSPATLTIRASLDKGGYVMGIHIAGSQDEPLAPALSEDQSDANITVMTVTVSHFSDLIFVYGAKTFDGMEWLSKPSDAYVNTHTHTLVKVTADLNGEFNVVGKKRSYRYRWKGPQWTLTGIFDTSGQPVLDPLWPHNPADPGTNTNKPSLKIDQSFLCKKVGQFKINYRGWADVPGSFTIFETGTGKVIKQSNLNIRSQKSTSVETRNCIARVSDAKGDYIDSQSSNKASYTCSCFDINGHGALALQMEQKEVDEKYNQPLFSCGQVKKGIRTVCPTNVQPMPPGKVFTFASSFEADVPTSDSGHSYIYSVVMDSDGKPANNWKFVPPYDWDLFRDADRWYQLIYDHKTKTWKVTVSQVSDTQKISALPSTARAVIQGKTVTWHISASEFSVPSPAYRVTSFGHDGKFSVTDRGADVSGSDPSKPLTDPGFKP